MTMRWLAATLAAIFVCAIVGVPFLVADHRAVPVSCVSMTASVGDTLTLNAAAQNAAGDTLPRSVLDFTTTDRRVASVDSFGVVIPLDSGRTRIRFAAKELAGCVDLHVQRRATRRMKVEGIS